MLVLCIGFILKIIELIIELIWELLWVIIKIRNGLLMGVSVRDFIKVIYMDILEFYKDQT